MANLQPDGANVLLGLCRISSADEIQVLTRLGISTKFDSVWLRLQKVPGYPGTRVPGWIFEWKRYMYPGTLTVRVPVPVPEFHFSGWYPSSRVAPLPSGTGYPGTPAPVYPGHGVFYYCLTEDFLGVPGTLLVVVLVLLLDSCCENTTAGEGGAMSEPQADRDRNRSSRAGWQGSDEDLQQRATSAISE
eukprot:3936919-Rhodomonas_salina.1